MVVKSTGGDRVLPPDGLHKARCIAVIDVGTQTSEFKGVEKQQRKVLIQFELPEETHVFDEDEDARPLVVQKEYTANLGDKANLRKDLENWRSKPFTEEELKGFDLKTLLGVACMLTTTTKTSKAGNKYTDITAIVPMVKGSKCPKQINDTMYFSLDDSGEEEFETLHEWIQKKIQASPEGAHFGQKQKVKEAVNELIDEADKEDDVDDDDLPF